MSVRRPSFHDPVAPPGVTHDTDRTPSRGILLRDPHGSALHRGRPDVLRRRAGAHPCPPRRGARRPVHVLDSCPRSDRGRTTSDMSSGEHANRGRSAPRSVLLSGGTDVTAQVAAPTRTSGARIAVQKVGTFLSGMIMPNIAAFIAWGFITAFFIQTGWTPVPGLGGFGVDDAGAPNVGLVGPMIRFMLPLLIAMQGGRMVYGVRGGVVAVVATMGVIVSTEQPMFLGALIMAPLAAWVMKQLDKLWEGKIKPGFEMLVSNFSAGIAAAALAVLGYFSFGPAIEKVSQGLGNGVDWLVAHSLLPLASLIIEPAKVLFLNNAINHGVLTPLGVTEAARDGKSILFLLEANPGPGLGVLLAYSIFGTGLAKATAPGAIVIQFFGGIHEIYFPYVLAKPKLLLGTIAGGMVGIGTLVVFNAGLRAPAAPGSIIAVFAQTPSGSFLGVRLSVLLAATTSFLICSLLLRMDRNKDTVDLAAATAEMEALKGSKSSVAGLLSPSDEAAVEDQLEGGAGHGTP